MSLKIDVPPEPQKVTSFGITQYLSLCDCLTSLRTASSRSVRVAARVAAPSSARRESAPLQAQTAPCRPLTC